MRFTIELSWGEENETMFNVEIEGKEHEIMASLIWVTRGSLMASRAKRAIAYDDQGFPVVSYIQ